MYLEATFPDNIDSEMLFETKLVPCVIKVAEEFHIHFCDPLVNVSGVVKGWEKKELNKRCPAKGGGKYLHHRHAQVTLKPTEPDKFEIVDMNFFSPGLGWLEIVQNSLLAEPGKWGRNE